MEQKAAQLESASQNNIRTETVLSRFPVHRLAKRGNISIDIKETTDGGEVKTRWEVSYNSKYGQPGPLAYKVDSLIVNRRIEEASRPIPKIIKLGSLRDICRELGLNEGKATRDVKKALLQNASAFITAKRSYKGTDGAERTAEISDTRYGVIFTGEKFPDGGRADAVYALLHDSYRDVINTAPTRPLDYDYLRELPPAPQRFYELLSYQIFAALRNERPRAKMLYSYLCARAPQTRYFDYEHVKKQMYKLHNLHRKSGYIAAIEFRGIPDGEGRADWEMLYTPGSKAKAEFKAFTAPSREVGKTRKKTQQPLLPSPTKPPATQSSEPQESAPSSGEVNSQLINILIEHGVHPDAATELVGTELEEVRRQLEYLPHRTVKRNKAGLLRDAVLGHWTPPDEYLEFQRREQEQRDSSERKKKKAAETEQAKQRQQDEEARRIAHFDYLRVRAGENEKTQPDRFTAFLNDSAAKRAEVQKDPSHDGQAKRIYLRLFDDEESHLERFREFYDELTFEQWVLQRD